MGLSQFDERAPRREVFRLTADNGDSFQFWFEVTGDPFRIDQLYVTSTDSIDHGLEIHFEGETVTDHNFPPVLIPAGAGGLGVPLVDVLFAMGWTAAYLILVSHVSVQVRVVEACSADTNVTIYAEGGIL